MLRHDGRSKRMGAGFLLALGFAAWSATWPSTAHAHVKWFSPFDLSVAPSPPTFFMLHDAWLLGLALSIPALWLTLGLDRLGNRWGFPPRNRKLSTPAVYADEILRLTIGVWLSWLWALPTPVFLTPELVAQTPSVQWFQLLLSVFCFSRRTTWISGVGLAALYAVAISQYGLFHLADYPLFLGIAAYLIGISARHWRSEPLRRLAHHRHSLLLIAMAATLCWASIEKWAYPSWSIPILAEHTHLALGLKPEIFMALAGWVEFGLAILLVIGGHLSARFAALLLFIMFTSAVTEFGKIDLIGHLPIIASLALVIMRGNENIGNVAGFAGHHTLVRLAALPVGYFAALAITISAYLGGWRLAYDNVFLHDWKSDLAVSLVAFTFFAVTALLTMSFIEKFIKQCRLKLIPSNGGAQANRDLRRRSKESGADSKVSKDPLTTTRSSPARP